MNLFVGFLGGGSELAVGLSGELLRLSFGWCFGGFFDGGFEGFLGGFCGGNFLLAFELEAGAESAVSFALLGGDFGFGLERRFCVGIIESDGGCYAFDFELWFGNGRGSGKFARLEENLDGGAETDAGRDVNVTITKQCAGGRRQSCAGIGNTNGGLVDINGDFASIGTFESRAEMALEILLYAVGIGNLFSSIRKIEIENNAVLLSEG